MFSEHFMVNHLKKKTHTKKTPFLSDSTGLQFHKHNKTKLSKMADLNLNLNIKNALVSVRLLSIETENDIKRRKHTSLLQ